MLRIPRETRRLAAILSATAGFVDAVGYLSVGGFFVSFMSGNSTRLAASAAAASAQVFVAGLLLLAFVGGVAIGTTVARKADRHARSRVLALVSLLLAAACIASPWSAVGGMLPAAAAMGAVNAVFVNEGGLPVGLTYMTGTLVRMGHELGGAGRSDGGWKPYAWHWLALVAGATLGALSHQWAGSQALWLAAGVVGVLAWEQRTT